MRPPAVSSSYLRSSFRSYDSSGSIFSRIAGPGPPGVGDEVRRVVRIHLVDDFGDLPVREVA
jgi:hypothetical protein